MKKRSGSITRNIGPLIQQVRALVHTARSMVATSVNTLQVLTNFEIGRLIVEHEQQGRIRAEYGKQLLKELAVRLTSELGPGFSRSNLQNMRSFFLLYKDRQSQICQKPSGKLIPAQIRQKVAGELATISTAPTRKLNIPFALSWSHYVILMGIKDAGERSFYEIESAQSGWSIPELKRQLGSSLYERLALSRNK